MTRSSIHRDALVVGFVLLLAAVSAAAPKVVVAGDQLAVNGNGGDCWRPLTPLNCRSSWYSGDRHSIYLRIINQLYDTGLWNAATTACYNWETSPGPQYCSSTPTTNDSWDYFKRDDGYYANNGYTWNCSTANGCPAVNPLNIQWSEIYVLIANDANPAKSISVDAHEIGHTLGLDHHGTAGSNVAVMTENTNWQKPNSIDIGPLPACATNPQGSNGTGGVRCVFDATY